MTFVQVVVGVIKCVCVCVLASVIIWVVLFARKQHNNKGTYFVYGRTERRPKHYEHWAQSARIVHVGK